MNNLVLFILHVLFWELVLIGIPVAITAIGGWIWWRHLPEAEKQQYDLSRKPPQGQRCKRSGLTTDTHCICARVKVCVDVNWNAAIADFKLKYVVGSIVTILILIAVIFAIPSAIAFIWWISHGRDNL
jgi:hypothetical protein